jgi:hypothetical protein
MMAFVPEGSLYDFHRDGSSKSKTAYYSSFYSGGYSLALGAGKIRIEEAIHGSDSACFEIRAIKKIINL